MRTALSKEDANTTGGKSSPDSYAAQIIKYIPAEVVAFYLPAMATAAKLTGTANIVTLWAIFIAGLVGTFLYMRRTAVNELKGQGVTYSGQRASVKAMIAASAFVIWALFLGGAWAFIADYQTYGTLLILAFTLLSPFLYEGFHFPLRLSGKQVTVKVKYDRTIGNTPGNITEVTIINHSQKDLETKEFLLFCDKGMVNSQPDSTRITAKKTSVIKPKSLQFNTTEDIHFLRVKFSDDSWEESAPFSSKEIA
jgi:hypothetical protein